MTVAGRSPRLAKLIDGAYERLLASTVHRRFFTDLIRHTNNFGSCTWLGAPIWQNVLDLWTIQETIAEVRPELLIECGSYRGGSALFYANLFDLLGRGRVISIDIARLHSLTHPRATFLVGNTVDEQILEQVDAAVSECAGPVMVVLDGDHTAAHVSRELEAYAPMVTPGSFILVQDGVIDVLDEFLAARPGPLVAVSRFLQSHPDFEVDRERCRRFLISHHPSGWLRRRGAESLSG